MNRHVQRKASLCREGGHLPAHRRSVADPLALEGTGTILVVIWLIANCQLLTAAESLEMNRRFCFLQLLSARNALYLRHRVLRLDTVALCFTVNTRRGFFWLGHRRRNCKFSI